MDDQTEPARCMWCRQPIAHTDDGTCFHVGMFRLRFCDLKEEHHATPEPF